MQRPRLIVEDPSVNISLLSFPSICFNLKSLPPGLIPWHLFSLYFSKLEPSFKSFPSLYDPSAISHWHHEAFSHVSLLMACFLWRSFPDPDQVSRPQEALPAKTSYVLMRLLHYKVDIHSRRKGSEHQTSYFAHSWCSQIPCLLLVSLYHESIIWWPGDGRIELRLHCFSIRNLGSMNHFLIYFLDFNLSYFQHLFHAK